jgi:pimeloyl-ACP methyl ester carboxylesterase
VQSVTASDGRTLTFREGGDPSGVPVFYLHGTPGSSLLYEPSLADAGDHGIRLISYDRPGFGGSTRRQGRTVADCAEDVAAVAGALGIARFCVWGISGGGPHALAVAALLPERVIAAAALASPAPYDAEGLDWFAGMGEQNVEEFKLMLEGEEAHRASMERQREEILAVTPAQLADAWSSLLGPSDREVVTGDLAAFVIASMRAGIEANGDGWIDDDLCFLAPWGFDFASIRVPVQLWHGEQDKFVPFDHGLWLAGRIPGVNAHLTGEDGHLTLLQHRIPQVHAWLLKRATLSADAVA